MADNWQLKAVLSAVDHLSPTLKAVGLTAKNTRKYLSDVANSAGALGGKIGLPLAALSGALGGFSLLAIKNAVTGFTDMGEAVYKSSLRTGMAVEDLQRMRYVAEQAGVPIEALEGSLGKLNKNIGAAAAGKNKDLASLFKRLGVETRDANGQLKSGIDLLPELADAFKRNENPVVQARMGMALFGKSWQEIVPLLAEGSEGIAAGLERFKRLKGVMSLDDIKGAKELGDKFKDLSFVTKGFQMTIAKELVPVISPLVEDFVQWAAANRKVIASGVKEFVRDFAASMKQIDWAGVLQGAREFGATLGKMVDWIGGPKNALIALAVVMNAQTIMAMAGLVASIARAGFALGGLALSALAPVAPLQILSASLLATNAKAAMLLGTVGKLGAAAGIAGAAFAGWEIGSWANENIVNPGMEKLTGEKGQTLGGWIYDKLHPDEGQDRPSLVQQAGQAKVGGEIKVSFKDAPPGMRVEQVNAGPVSLNPDVGYRSDALGMP